MKEMGIHRHIPGDEAREHDIVRLELVKLE